jgi:hypothetical protein
VRVPVVRGVIERRLLVNYRVDPVTLRAVLPFPFRPQLVKGFAIAGICLIRLSGIRPLLVPQALGVSSENAAHRIAVEWDEGATTHHGVYIPRRDSSSRLNRLLGGRLFPGVHHAARFDVSESEDTFRVRMDSVDRSVHVRVEGALATVLPATSVFTSVPAASAFFEQGALGYSVTGQPGVFDGLELRSLAWKVEPLAVRVVESSFFEDRGRFPIGSTEFDCALVMRNIAHEWHARDQLCAAPAAPAA